MRARLLAVLLAAALVVMPMLAGAASAQGADAQGWWTTLNQAGLPAPPAPPDVGSDDLLVQGGDLPRLAGQPAAPTAVAALRFTVPADADVGALVLQTGAGAQAADVRAYPAAGDWQPAQGGPAADAPDVDPVRYSAGRLAADGTTLSFPDIGRLVTEDGLLSVVLVPGPTDRVVVHHPAATALAVTAPEQGPPPAPGPPPAAPAAAPAQPVSAPLAPVAAVPAFAAVPPPAPALAAPPAVPAPTTAAPPAAALRPVRSLVADDGRTRLLVGLEAALVLIFFGLLGHGPLGRLAALAGLQEEVRTARGIGRFRAERAGSAPQL